LNLRCLLFTMIFPAICVKPVRRHKIRVKSEKKCQIVCLALLADFTRTSG
jgi:hypothetical protein